jgi:hypothetical protein
LVTTDPRPERRRAVCCWFLASWLAAGVASAWFVEGHRRVAIDAVRLSAPTLPSFFREGAAAVGEGAVDPDVLKAPGTPALRDVESPEHFFDWERLEGRPLPGLRSQYLRLMSSLRRDPAATGTLPYAILEGTDRLTLAFAEHRRWPADPLIRGKLLLWAGHLAHYAADLCQPLHTTIHHDGRLRPDGSSPGSGIHQEVDALFESVPFDRAAAVRGIVTAPAGDLRAALLEELAASHRLVDVVYQLETSLPPRAAGRPWPASTVDFTAERYRAAVRFVAILFHTAWERSAAIELPGWLERPGR